MDPRADEGLLEEMQGELGRRSFPDEPAVTAPLDAAVYGPERHAREMEAVFRRAWLQVAPLEDLAEPGDFVALDVAGSPLVLTRTPRGELCAMHNVCRHRGAQIVRAERGRLRELVCPYHALRYGLDGVLAGMPVPESFPARARPGELCLPRVRVAAWRGQAWITLDPGAPSLERFLGEALALELAPWPLERCRRISRRVREASFDWKVGVEAFLESLHVPSIHRGTANPLIDFRGTVTAGFGPHSRMATPFRYADAYAPEGVLGKPAREAGVACFEGLGAARRAANFSYLVFPATVYNLLPNHFTVFRLWPVAPGRTRFESELYALPPADERARAFLDSIDRGYLHLVEEDLENLPWIQKGVEDVELRRLELSWYERRIRDFRRAVERALRGGPW